jgi:glycosyltransferase involved in cell wall biosynthesis
MKIAAIIENKITAGGGFAMSVDLLLSLKKAVKNSNYEIVIFNYHDENSKILKNLGLKFINVKESIFDKIFAFVNYSLLGSFFQSKLKIHTFFEKNLIKQKIDFVFFVTPSPKPFYLQKLNYALTVYDLCHRDFPEFSEVKAYNIYHLRELILNRCIGPATIVITESEKLKHMISKQFSKNIDRIVSIPNGPSPLLTSLKDQVDIKKISLPKKYFFYPAQFWEHKNHIRIVEAINILKEKNIIVNFVFCGKDKGNLQNVKKKITNLNIINQVKIFNFLSNEEVKIAYKNAIALVMPSYFGPTNIPPLDAWENEIPVIYSNHLKEQTLDAALYADPNSSKQLAEQIKKMLNEDLRQEFINKGKIRLNEIKNDRENAINELSTKLNEFEKKQENWKKN